MIDRDTLIGIKRLSQIASSPLNRSRAIDSIVSYFRIYKKEGRGTLESLNTAIECTQEDMTIERQVISLFKQVEENKE